MNSGYVLLILFVISLITIILRFMPFLIFGRKESSKIIDYLGEYLPYTIMPMLVVFCLKDLSFNQISGFLPSLIGIGIVVILQCWKRNYLLSVSLGTIIYMILIRIL